MDNYWLLLLPLAAASGWYYAKRPPKARGKKAKKSPRKLPKDYIKGLNLLLSEEPDKAVDLFIKMLEVDSDTVETHLTLGNLFRRRGQVDRAIRIHQNLIARPKLATEYRLQALLALAQDYQSAGVLDRAEKLYLELIDLGQHLTFSLKSLLAIYEQEKEWEKAIDTARLFSQKTKRDLSIPISQYYCELADIQLKKKQYDQVNRLGKLALQHNKASVRAPLIIAKAYSEQNQYADALNSLKPVSHTENADVFNLMIDIYRKTNDRTALTQYIQQTLGEHPKMEAALNTLTEDNGLSREEKIHITRELLREHPSLAGLNQMIALQLVTAKAEVKEDLLILHGLAQRLQAEQPDYQCKECGFLSKHAYWQCPSCKTWESLEIAQPQKEELDK